MDIRRSGGRTARILDLDGGEIYDIIAWPLGEVLTMLIGYELDGPQSRFERSVEEKGLFLNREWRRRPLLPCPARSHSRDSNEPPTSNWIVNTKIRITYMHWKGFSTNCASKISVEQKVSFLQIHLGRGYIICFRVGQGKYIILIYVVVGQPRRERGN